LKSVEQSLGAFEAHAFTMLDCGERGQGTGSFLRSHATGLFADAPPDVPKREKCPDADPVDGESDSMGMK
jgi:hypothetical protein